jgi:hypothetical protein
LQVPMRSPGNGYTVLLLTLRYVHELSIRRLLFVYTTEG